MQTCIEKALHFSISVPFIRMEYMYRIDKYFVCFSKYNITPIIARSFSMARWIMKINNCIFQIINKKLKISSNIFIEISINGILRRNNILASFNDPWYRRKSFGEYIISREKDFPPFWTLNETRLLEFFFACGSMFQPCLLAYQFWCNWFLCNGKLKIMVSLTLLCKNIYCHRWFQNHISCSFFIVPLLE